MERENNIHFCIRFYFLQTSPKKPAVISFFSSNLQQFKCWKISKTAFSTAFNLKGRTDIHVRFDKVVLFYVLSVTCKSFLFFPLFYGKRSPEMRQNRYPYLKSIFRNNKYFTKLNYWKLRLKITVKCTVISRNIFSNYTQKIHSIKWFWYFLFTAGCSSVNTRLHI